jgi:hypothetical protein
MVTREIELNRRYARALGWKATDVGASAIDGDLVGAVRDFQRREPGLVADGVLGPLSYQRWLDERLESDLGGLAHLGGDALVRRAGGLAVARAKSLWLNGIIDPPTRSERHDRSRRFIDDFIRGPGGLLWGWEAPYVQNGDFEWCGSFVATAWSAVRLGARWRESFFASAYRLDRWGQYLAMERARNPVHPEQPRRYLRLDERSSAAHVSFAEGDEHADPQPGDILLVGGEGTGFGKHITLVESWDPDTGRFTTLEGNATGAGPSGERIHGVVRTTRRVGLDRGLPPTTYHARRLIRPSPHDLGS